MDGRGSTRDRRVRWRDPAGSISAEYIGAVVLVGAIIAAVWATDISDRVSLASQELVCDMFDDDSWDCPTGPSAGSTGTQEAVEAEPASVTDADTDDQDATDPTEGDVADDPTADDTGPDAEGDVGGQDGSGGPAGPQALIERYADGTGTRPVWIEPSGGQPGGWDLTGDGTPDVFDTTGDGTIDMVADPGLAGLIGTQADPDALVDAIRDGATNRALGSGIDPRWWTLTPDQRAEILGAAAEQFGQLFAPTAQLFRDRFDELWEELTRPARDELWDRNPDNIDPDQAAANARLLAHLLVQGATLPEGADGTDPRDVHLAIDSLGWTEAQLQAAARERPELYGQVDGVPFHARDAANRELLDDEIDAFTDRVAANERNLRALWTEQGADPGDIPDDLSRMSLAELRDLGRQIEHENRPDPTLAAATEVAITQLGFDRRVLSNMRDWRDDPGTGDMRLSIVALDTHGDGQVTLGRGDLDRADHVSTIFPGAETNLANLQGLYVRDWMDNLQRAKQRAIAQSDASGSAATILSLNYDPPETAFPGGASRGRAEEGASGLPSLARAIDLVERDTTSSFVHSYASLKTGIALMREADYDGIASDYIVPLGSPGMGTRIFDDFGLRGRQEMLVGRLTGDMVNIPAAWNYHGSDPHVFTGPSPLSPAIDLELPTPESQRGLSRLFDPFDRSKEIHQSFMQRDSRSLEILAEVGVGIHEPEEP